MNKRKIQPDNMKKPTKLHHNFSRTLEKFNRVIENKTIWLLVLIFVVSILSKIFFIPSMGAILFPLTDEHIFIELAKNFFYHYNFVSNLFFNIKQFNEVLFSLLLSPLYAFYSPDCIITVFRIYGLIVMSSAVFPAYKLGLAILKNKKQALLISGFSVLVPEMTLAFSVVQEVIYYPLFLFTVYVIYKRISGNGFGPIFLGFLFFLLWTCKAVGATLFAGYIFYLLYDFVFIEKFRHFKNNVAQILIICVTVFGLRELLSLAIRYLNYGTLAAVDDFYVSSALSRLSVPQINFIPDLLYGIAHYLFFVALIFMIFPLILPVDNIDQYDFKDRKFLVFLMISLIMTILTVVVLIYSAEGGAAVEAQRVHYRYLFPYFVLFLIMMLKLDFKRLKFRLFGLLYSIFFILYYLIFKAKFDPGSIIDSKSLLLLANIQYISINRSTLTFLLVIMLSVIVGYLIYYKVSRIKLKMILFQLICIILIINQAYAIRYTYWYYNTGTDGITRKNEYSTLSRLVNIEPGTPIYVNPQKWVWQDVLYTTQSRKDLLTARPSQNPLEFFYDPQNEVNFLITAKNVSGISKIQNVKLLETGLTLFNVYQFTNRPNGIIKFDYLLQNTYADNWLMDDSVLIIAGVEGENQIEVVLSLNTATQAINIGAILTDSTGKVFRVQVSPNGKTVTLLFNKNSDEQNFRINLGSENYFVPAELALDDDTRKLTYYISSVEVK